MGLQAFVVKYKTEIYEEWATNQQRDETAESFYAETCSVVRQAVQVLLEMLVKGEI